MNQGDDSHLGDVGVDPDAAPSQEDRTLTDELVDVLEEIPTITDDEVRDRHRPRQNSVFGDEWSHLTHRKQYEPARLGLPGFGTTQPDCGVNIPHVCEDCGHRIDVGRTCAQSRCPRCAPAWVLKRAPGIVARIMSAAKMKDGAQYKHHVAASPPPDLLVDAPKDEEPEDVIIDKLQKYCRRIGFDGIILYHPWSGDNTDEDADPEDLSFTETENDDRGEWKKRLFNGRDWEDVRAELQHRPHFHLIGACEHFPGGDVTKGIYERTRPQPASEHGWIFHRITERNGSPVSLGDVEAVARAVCYALSHVGIDTRGEGDNKYVRGKVGSAYHNAKGPAHEANVREARQAVRKVAPAVLGIPRMDVQCGGETPADEHDTTPDDLEDEGDGADDQEATAEDDTTGMTRCNGVLVDVDRADFIEDEGWQQRALYAEEAIEARREWQEAGGWQGWQERHTGQSTLPTGPPDDAPAD